MCARIDTLTRTEARRDSNSFLASSLEHKLTSPGYVKPTEMHYVTLESGVVNGSTFELVRAMRVVSDPHTIECNRISDKA